MTTDIDINAITERVHRDSRAVDRILQQMDRVVVGQRHMVERLVIGLLCNGHVLLEGVPGLAKTLTVSTLSRIIGGQFKRLQFTPDLLPADLTGTLVFDQGSGAFRPKKGPIFANLVLADEVNRAPAKVQSALLESMQERQVTIGDETYPLDDPFLVMATQNPIEQEGTYPLPEAQIDRFMLKVKVGYPSREEERAILDRMAEEDEIAVEPVVSLDDIRALRHSVRLVYVDDKIKEYAVDLVHATRDPEGAGMSELTALIEFGSSPRGDDLPGEGRPGPRLHSQEGIRNPGRRQGGWSRRAAPPHRRQLRGRGRGDRLGGDRQAVVRRCRGSVRSF